MSEAKRVHVVCVERHGKWNLTYSSEHRIDIMSFSINIGISFQFVAGIGLPVDLEPEALTLGYVFKAQYFLPYNVSQLHATRLSRDIKVDDYEIDRSTDDGVRWSIYQVLDILLRRQMKIDGRQCVLRAICEATQLPFTHESGLLGELLHILLVWVPQSHLNQFEKIKFPSFICSPSTTAKGEVKNDFQYAEVLGRRGENCKNAFHQCTFSLMGILSAIHELDNWNAIISREE